MSVLDRLRREASPVARRRRVSAARSWVTWSPARAKGVGLVVAVVLAVGIFGAVARSSMWVADVNYDAQMDRYEKSLVVQPAGPTLAPPLSSEPVLVDPEVDVVTRRFMKAWLAGPSAKDQKVWLDGLRPVTEQTMLDALATADRSIIVKATVKGVAAAPAEALRARSEVTLTKGGPLSVGLARSPAGWVVTDFSSQAD